jgi:glycosyltransferase involved in cell wall biosynthesis
LQNERLFEFGVSPNKLFDYMYSSTPVIHSINTPKDLVQLANCGLSVEDENSEEIKEAILKLYQMDEEERIILGASGKEYVLNNFTYEKLAKQYLSLFK